MNSALYQELINPSQFNLIAALALIVLIALSLIAILITVLKRSVRNNIEDPKSQKGGKGF
tara:strand:- start:713 stop:892 length:180 start_codon:yes stop_codon:yes gene_type:complete